MKKVIQYAAFGILAACCVTASLNCGGAQSTATTANATTNARAVARGAIETAETAWITVAKACTNAGDAELEQQCADILLPIRAVMIGAAVDVDNWGQQDQLNFACAMKDTMAGINEAVVLLSQHQVALPQVVSDAFDLANLVSVKCVRSADAGGQ